MTDDSLDADAEDPSVVHIRREALVSADAARRRSEICETVPAVELAAKDRLGPDFAGVWCELVDAAQVVVATSGRIADFSDFQSPDGLQFVRLRKRTPLAVLEESSSELRRIFAFDAEIRADVDVIQNQVDLSFPARYLNIDESLQEQLTAFASEMRVSVYLTRMRPR